MYRIAWGYASCTHRCSVHSVQAHSAVALRAALRPENRYLSAVASKRLHSTRPRPGSAYFWVVRCPIASGQVAHAALHPAGSAGASEVARIASLSRIFIGVRPGFARNLGRVAKPSGPLSVLIVIFTVIGALLAAIWQRIVSNVRECSACHGFGIARCGLCRGMGSVGWEGKFRHNEPCPVCLGRRYTECQHCGGRFHRPLFSHARRDPASFAESLQENYSAVGARVMED